MKKLKFNWGWGIAIVYTAFALATLGFVAFAMTQKVDLVQDDYYEQSLRHDATMLARSNAMGLGTRSQITFSSSDLIVQIPVEHSEGVRGTVALYKASVMDADKLYTLKTDATGAMSIATSALQPGLYKVTVRWNVDDIEYEMQGSLTIGQQ